MQLSIRWKFILSIGITLLVTYLGLLTWDYWWQHETAAEQMQQLVRDRAQSIASGMNEQLGRVETLVESLAANIERQPTPGEIQVRLNQSQRQIPNGTQLFVVLDPSQTETPGTPVGWRIGGGGQGARGFVSIGRQGRGQDRGGDRFPPTSRGAREGRDIQMGGPNFSGPTELKNFDRSEIFYAKAIEQRRGVWSDPHSIENPNSPPRATYSSPLIVNDKVMGVVAAAVRPELPGMQAPGGRGRNGRGGPPDEPGGGPPDGLDRPPMPTTEPSELFGIVREFTIIGSEGQIIMPPPAPGEKRVSLIEWSKAQGLQPFTDDLRSAVEGESTAVRVEHVRDVPNLVPGAVSGEDYWVAFAPVGTTGWLVTSAISESQYMNRFVQRLYQRAFFLAGGFVVLLGVTTLVSIRISRPIERMARAVSELASGNLDAHVSGVSSHDEIGQLARAFNTMTGQLKQHIAALTEQTAARQNVEAELRIARQIQTDLLPRKFPDNREIELHAVNVAAQRVAGDFYDFFFAPNDQLTIAIADVSGKGMPAALLMAVTRTIIRNLAMEGMSPQQIVERANTLLVQDIANSMFVSLFLCQYDIRTGKIIYVNAGHPRPYRFDRSGKARQLGDVTGAILGVEPNSPDWNFEQCEEQLQPGETLLLYTDGVTEARKPDGTMLRDAGLEQMIARHATEDVAQLCSRFVEELDEFQNGQQVDDITLVALRRTV